MPKKTLALAVRPGFLVNVLSIHTKQPSHQIFRLKNIHTKKISHKTVTRHTFTLKNPRRPLKPNLHTKQSSCQTTFIPMSLHRKNLHTKHSLYIVFIPKNLHNKSFTPPLQKSCTPKRKRGRFKFN